MTTTSFGRRGSATVARPTPSTSRAIVSEREPEEPAAVGDHLDWTSAHNDLFAQWPLLTLGVVVLLALVFALQIHFAFDMGPKRAMSLESLMAFGGSSRDLVIGDHQVWRIFTAPMLHGDTSHLLGNCFALAFLGYRLEPLVGRGWFGLIYVVGGLGGGVASLIGNPPGVITVGASGAISGLIGAVFVMSFHANADPERQTRMRKTALRFGVPAILPMFWNMSNGVDYFAHAGGALAGALMGLVLMVHWRRPTPRPSNGDDAGTGALLGFTGVMIASIFVVMQYPVHKARAAERAPINALTTATKKPGSDAQALAAKYDKDPRVHFVAGAKHLGESQFAAAEREMRQVLTLIPEGAGGQEGGMRDKAGSALALALAAQSRMTEAREVAVPFCRRPKTGRDDYDRRMREAFDMMKLCS